MIDPEERRELVGLAVVFGVALLSAVLVYYLVRACGWGAPPAVAAPVAPAALAPVPAPAPAAAPPPVPGGIGTL